MSVVSCLCLCKLLISWLQHVCLFIFCKIFIRYFLLVISWYFCSCYFCAAVVTAVTELGNGKPKFYSTPELIAFCRKWRLPTNHVWLFSTRWRSGFIWLFHWLIAINVRWLGFVFSRHLRGRYFATWPCPTERPWFWCAIFLVELTD